MRVCVYGFAIRLNILMSSALVTRLLPPFHPNQYHRYTTIYSNIIRYDDAQQISFAKGLDYNLKHKIADSALVCAIADAASEVLKRTHDHRALQFRSIVDHANSLVSKGGHRQVVESSADSDAIEDDVLFGKEANKEEAEASG